MVIFWRLMFGHLLSDFTFQTNFINRWKRQSNWGLLAHCATHPLTYVVLTWPFLRDNWINLPFVSLNGWACIGLIFASHFLEDWWRIYTIYRYKTPDNTIYFAWDQIIHWAVIFAVMPDSFRGVTPTLIPERWPVIGCLFVIVTHAATVIIYFIEKDLYGRNYPGTGEKYLTMCERVVLALTCLVPGNFWPMLAVLWLSFMHWVRLRRVLDLSWMSFYVGGALSLACGLLARFVYYS